MKKIKNKIIAISTGAGFLFVVASGIALAEDIGLLVPIPGADQAITEVSGMAEYLVGMYKFGLAAVGILAMAMIMFGGFSYITGSYTGMVGKTADGKEIIKSALTGLAIGLLSWMLINTIDPKLTKVRDILLTPPEITVDETRVCADTCSTECWGQGKIAVPPYIKGEECTCDCKGTDAICNSSFCNLKAPDGMKVGTPVYSEIYKSCDCDYIPDGLKDKEELEQKTCVLECQGTVCDADSEVVAIPTDDGCDCKCVESGEVTTPEIDLDEGEGDDGGIPKLPNTDDEEISWTTIEDKEDITEYTCAYTCPSSGKEFKGITSYCDACINDGLTVCNHFCEEQCALSQSCQEYSGAKPACLAGDCPASCTKQCSDNEVWNGSVCTCLDN